MSDYIEVRGLRVLATHGVLPAERLAAQPFELDLDVETDLAASAGNDDLGLTVDYGPLVERVRDVVERRHFELLEALAQAVADEVLDDDRVSSVRVAVRKLRPPIAADVSTVGVVITRCRDGS